MLAVQHYMNILRLQHEIHIWRTKFLCKLETFQSLALNHLFEMCGSNHVDKPCVKYNYCSSATRTNFKKYICNVVQMYCLFLLLFVDLISFFILCSLYLLSV